MIAGVSARERSGAASRRHRGTGAARGMARMR